jgi:molybdopterin synthase sulfur carrier subunit
MRLKVKLLKPLSDGVGNKELQMDVDGRTLDDLLKVLVEKYPKLRDQLYSGKESLSDHVNVFINDKPVTGQDEMATRLRDGDEILLFIPISGG